VNCEKAQEYILDYVDHPEQVPTDARKHLKGCADCEKEITVVQRMNGLMETDKQTITTPVGVRSSVKETIREELTGSSGFVNLLLAFLIGLGMAWMAVQSLPVTGSTGWVASCGLWWGGLFVMGVTLMVGGIKISNGRTSAIASISTVSAGLVFGGLYLCPGVQGMTGFTEAIGLQSILHTLAGPAGAYLLVGFLYALIPTTVVTMIMAKNIPDQWGIGSGLAGLGFILLMAPMLYVECFLLPPLGAVLLLLGIVVGSIGGPLSGLAVRYYVPKFR